VSVLRTLTRTIEAGTPRAGMVGHWTSDSGIADPGTAGPGTAELQLGIRRRDARATRDRAPCRRRRPAGLNADVWGDAET